MKQWMDYGRAANTVCHFARCDKENVVAETQGMIPDTKSRLSNAMDDLNGFMVCRSHVTSLSMLHSTCLSHGCIRHVPRP